MSFSVKSPGILPWIHPPSLFLIHSNPCTLHLAASPLLTQSLPPQSGLWDGLSPPVNFYRVTPTPTNRDPARPQDCGLPGTVLRVYSTPSAQHRPVPIMSHINVHVVDELSGDVQAAIRLCIGRQVSVREPVSIHSVRVGPGWGCILHPGGGHHSHCLP